MEYKFVDRTGASAEPMKLIAPFVIPKEEIDAEIERLASLPAPANGRRESLIVNPNAGGNAFAPGTTVTLCVLKPGEQTTAIRHNSALINFSIQGAGQTRVDGKCIKFGLYDVWNTPGWATYENYNDTNELQVRLAYSNAALLEKLQVHVIDENPPAPGEEKKSPAHTQDKSPFGTFQLTEDGAYLMPYEQLINPEMAPHKPLYFQWTKVKEELDKLASLGQSYRGRRLYLLYNPATLNTNGTTGNYFATITIRPGNIVDRPHRHTSSAINYYFAGSGYSTVEGKRYTWKAGDLMFSAPGWAIHNHASNADPVYELTIQDSPLNIWMGSLLWQENLDHPLEALGSTGGFQTNRPS